MIKDFLPINKEDMIKRGWDSADFVFVTGDAYVDHPSFGAAVISRVLERHGYRVCIISQPDWNNPESITTFGKPKIGFLVSGGNMDTMVMHYTAAKKKRNFDYYSPNGQIGKRPDRATIVYCNLIQRTYKNTPIIIGGIEASLRRLAHYDYWSDKIRRSILIESGADILCYGMGEKSIVAISDCLSSGLNIKDITYIDGTVYRTKDIQNVYDAIKLPSFDEISTDKKTYAESFKTQYANTDPFSGKRLIEKYTDTEYIVQNPQSKPLTETEIDDIYALPYMRDAHPMYGKDGIPAISEVKFSITSHRGCYGGCSFCALTFHQGRIIQPRSHDSIINEAIELTKDKNFKGYINDVGGPTANFRKPACKKQLTEGACKNRQCLYPTPCKNLEVDHNDYVTLLKRIRNLKGVKKVFVRSGVRFDYLMLDKDDTFINDLCRYHVSGQLKVAPEHISDNVLSLMGKPKNDIYKSFIKKYNAINNKVGLKQYVVPYLMSSHPGSTLKDALELAEHLNENNINPEQVQDFYPTPSTVSTCMYYTGYDPRTMEKIYVARSYKEKAMQRALLQFKNPANYDLVHEALTMSNRTDLIGFSKKCLIPPRQIKSINNKYTNKSKKSKKDN